MQSTSGYGSPIRQPHVQAHQPEHSLTPDLDRFLSDTGCVSKTGFAERMWQPFRHGAPDRTHARDQRADACSDR